MDQTTPPPAILIVDDDPATLTLLSFYLRKLAPTYDILAAEDAQSALSHLAQRTIPLLITDHLLPDMDGLHLIAAVKAVSPLTHTMLMSASDTAELKQLARDQHVDTFLSKMKLLEQLVVVLRNVLPATSIKH